jgi:hypothetical protein
LPTDSRITATIVINTIAVLLMTAPFYPRKFLPART